jgi:hypothetical protein
VAQLDAGQYEGVDLFNSGMGFCLDGYVCEFIIKLEGLSAK